MKRTDNLLPACEWNNALRHLMCIILFNPGTNLEQIWFWTVEVQHADFFFQWIPTIVPPNPWFAESIDVELRIWKANYKVILEFLPAAGVWHPNPCIVQGSAVFCETRCIIITFKNRETEIQREEIRTNEENSEENCLWRNYSFMNKPEKVCEKTYMD